MLDSSTKDPAVEQLIIYQLHHTMASDDLDIEATSVSARRSLQDPYGIRKRIQSEEQIALLRGSRKGKSVVKYHQRQNDVLACPLFSCTQLTYSQLIRALLKPMEAHTADARDVEEKNFLPVRSLLRTCYILVLTYAQI